jgi:branched-chain amino acid transport system substrate-binding protein
LLVAACGSRRDEAELIELARGAGGVATTTTARERLVIGDIGSFDDDAGSSPAASVPGTGRATGGPTTAPAAGASSPRCARQLAPVVIGSVGQLSGVFGSILKPQVQAVQAWVASVNAAGGLRCHPIRYLTADDKGDPSTHQALVRRLVEEEGVIAFVNIVAPLSGNASLSYLAERRIPVVGTEGASPWVYGNPMYFPQHTSGEELLEGALAGAARYGRSHGGLRRYGQVSCIEAAQCSGLHGRAPEWAARYGLDLVYRGQVSLTQPDFTSACQSAQQAGAQLFVMGVDTNSVFRLLRACHSIGYRPVFITGGPLATPALAKDPEAQGSLIMTNTIPPTHTDNPSVARLAEVLARHAPHLDVDTATLTGWASAMLFERAARDLADTPTSQSILEGLWSIQDEDLGGITQPLTFLRGRTVPPRICYWTTEIRDGSYADVGGGERVCE